MISGFGISISDLLRFEYLKSEIIFMAIGHFTGKLKNSEVEIPKSEISRNAFTV
jgi:hypothetical protein